MAPNVFRAMLTLALFVGAGVPTAACADEVRSVRITATEYTFEPSRIEAEPGETLRIELVNDGRIAHSLKIEIDGRELKTETVQPGQGDALELTMPDREVAFSCTVPGHEPAGMKGAIVPR